MREAGTLDVRRMRRPCMRRTVCGVTPPVAELVTDLEWRLMGAEADWHLRHGLSEHLPTLATDALICGLDCPSLRLLAGERTTAIPVDLGELLAAALQELGWPVPDRPGAWRRLVAFRCWEIATGRVDAGAGAARVEALGYEDPSMPDDAERAVQRFLWLDDDWQGELTRTRAEVETEVVRLATDVVQRFLAGRALIGPP